MIKIEFHNQWKYLRQNCMGINIIEINIFNMFDVLRVLRIGLLGFSMDIIINKEEK